MAAFAGTIKMIQRGDGGLWRYIRSGISKFGIYLFDDVKKKDTRLTAEEIERGIPVKRWKSGFIRMDLYAKKICL